MKIKVIAIVHFAPKSNGKDPEAIDLGNGKFTRFYDSFQLWFYALGYNLMERYSKDLVFEIWEPDDKITEILTKKSDNNLVYKLFPGNIENVSKLTGIKKQLNSKLIFDSLENELKNNPNLVLFFRGTNEYILNKIVKKYFNKAPFVGMFSVNVSGQFIVRQFFRQHPFKMAYYYFNSLLPFKKHLIKVQNIVPSTQNDIKAIPFFKKLNIYYREHCSAWGIDVDFWSRNHNLDQSLIKEKFTIKPGEKVFLISSRIVQEKQVKEMLIALSKFEKENFRVIITGRNDGSKYSNEVKKIIDTYLSEKIIFTGYVTDEVLREIYFITDVMLSFSKSEGGPFSIFQAYLMEVPVIQSSVGIAGEIALQYSISRLVSPNSTDEFSGALSDFFKGKIPTILEREIAEKYFTWNSVAEYYFNVFQSVSKNFKGFQK